MTDKTKTPPDDEPEDDAGDGIKEATAELTDLPKDGNRRVIDIDAARAAREEEVGEAPVLRVAGVDHELPRSMPADFVTAIGEAGAYIEGQDLRMLTAFDTALRALLGDELFAELSGELDFFDRMAVLEGVLDVYGMSLPQSQASGR